MTDFDATKRNGDEDDGDRVVDDESGDGLTLLGKVNAGEGDVAGGSGDGEKTLGTPVASLSSQTTDSFSSFIIASSFLSLGLMESALGSGFGEYGPD